MNTFSLHHERGQRLEPDALRLRASLADWLRLIRAEYIEMPGLHLTLQQAQRLWNLDPATCAALLNALVNVRFLRRTANGAYARAN